MASPSGKISRRDLAKVLSGGLVVASLRARAHPQQSVELEQVCDHMVRNDEWRTAILAGYSVRRRYSLCRGSDTSNCAEMDVRMEYSYPGHKTFHVLSEKGSGTVQNHVFQRLIEAEVEASRDDIRDRTKISPQNYDFQLLGTDTIEGRPSYLIRLRPKHKRKFLVDGRIWVDTEDFAVTRIEGEPAETSFWVKSSHMVQRYKKFGPFWLVVSNHTNNEVRFFGNAQLNIDYTDYQIKSADPQGHAVFLREQPQ